MLAPHWPPENRVKSSALMAEAPQTRGRPAPGGAERDETTGVDVNAVAVAVASPNTPSGTPDAADIKKRSSSFISRRVLRLSQSKKQLGQQSKPAAEAPAVRRLASLQDGEIEAATRSPSVPRLPLSSPTAISREDERGRKRVGFGIRRMLGLFGEQRKNPQRHKLLPATSADMAGMLWKQGTKIGAWQRRYFVLHGALLSYYADEESAQEPDEGRLHGIGTVLDARLWGNARPAQIPDATCALPRQRACSPAYTRACKCSPRRPDRMHAVQHALVHARAHRGALTPPVPRASAGRVSDRDRGERVDGLRRYGSDRV